MQGLKIYKSLEPEAELEYLFLPEVQEEAKNKLKRIGRLSSETEECMTFFERLGREHGNDYMFRQVEAQWLYGKDY